MASQSTPEEVEANYLAAMGENLGRVYYELYKEVVWVHARWLEYRKLYAEKGNLELINRHGGFLFKLIQDALWDETLLHLARLTDPARTGKNENLSIRRLVELTMGSEEGTQINELANVVLLKSEFAREHRNKRLAHHDLNRSIPVATPLSGISRSMVEELLAALRDFMNFFEKLYCDRTVGFEHFMTRNDAERLVWSLKKLEELDDAH